MIWIANALMMVTGLPKCLQNLVYIFFFGSYFHYKMNDVLGIFCTASFAPTLVHLAVKYTP